MSTDVSLPSADHVAAGSELLELAYGTARTIATCDARIRAEVKQGNLQAATYPVAGLEGVCAALGVALAPTDYLVSTYRNLGDVIAKGVPLRAVIAEIAGRVTGVAKGKGGAMHIADSSHGLMTTTGIVGSGLPIAVGLALASSLDGDGRITAVTFGDGATSIGSFHEAVTLASVWKLPVLFLCQNNGWAEHTPIEEYATSTDIAERVSAYSIQTHRVDGFDTIATLAVLQQAVADVRAGRGPVFVEAITYRLAGHTSTTDFSYMPKDRLAEEQGREPVARLRRFLQDSGSPESRLNEIDTDAAALVDDAFSFAYSSDFPRDEDAYTDVLADSQNEAETK